MIGQTLSHYRVLAQLGQGGMGVVFRAEDTRLLRPVALKFLRPDLTADPGAKDRFLQEARSAAALDHPCICPVYEIDEADGRIFIAMALVEGESLKERIASGPLPIPEAVRIASQVAEGLRAAHARRIVHRDIKPGNILIAASGGQARITDFGLARLEEAFDATRTAATSGTLAYMSPEQARGEAVDHRADIWSLGCVLYEMLTGRLPFERDTPFAVLHAIQRDEPAPLASGRPDVPQHVADVVRRCLQKNLDRRYADLDTVLRDLAGSVGTQAPRPVSIAVLPFVDMSAGRDQEYFCDGIAEELINALAHVADLRVVARTSAFAFKGQSLDVREIGRRLDVGAVLEGSIRRAGDRLRITAQLIDVESGYHLWSEKFDRQMEDIFAIQDEVSAAVVESLKVRLLPAERALLSASRTVDPEAYSLYLKGRHFAWSPSPERIAKALDCFERAAKRDPGFAPVYVAIAEAHAASALVSISSTDESWQRVRAMLERALALDDQLASAHALAGYHAFSYDWDWPRAEQSFQRALALNPGLATAYAQHAWFHLAMGRPDEAVAEVRRAQALDPLLPFFYTISAGIHWMIGRFDEAIAEFEKAVELDPVPGLAHFHAAAAYFYKGRFDESERLLDKVISVDALAGWKESLLAFNCLARGNETGARQIARDLVERKRSRHVSSVSIAQVFAELGERDEAFRFLDQAYEERDTLMPFLNLVRELDSLRADPRFQALAAKMGLPPRPGELAAARPV